MKIYCRDQHEALLSIRRRGVWCITSEGDVWKLLGRQKVEVLSYPTLPDFQKGAVFRRFPGYARLSF